MENDVHPVILRFDPKWSEYIALRTDFTSPEPILALHVSARKLRMSLCHARSITVRLIALHAPMLFVNGAEYSGRLKRLLSPEPLSDTARLDHSRFSSAFAGISKPLFLPVWDLFLPQHQSPGPNGQLANQHGIYIYSFLCSINGLVSL